MDNAKAYKKMFKRLNPEAKTAIEVLATGLREEGVDGIAAATRIYIDDFDMFKHLLSSLNCKDSVQENERQFQAIFGILTNKEQSVIMDVAQWLRETQGANNPALVLMLTKSYMTDSGEFSKAVKATEFHNWSKFLGPLACASKGTHALTSFEMRPSNDKSWNNNLIFQVVQMASQKKFNLQELD